ncbi:MAG: AraC family transcriptional regulator [Myxococcales bacterium]|nr:AraC family transcriptional regulator [Myxococcales bacterium]
MPEQPLLTRMLPEHQNLQVRRFVHEACGGSSKRPRVHDHGIVAYQLSGRSVLWMGTSYYLEERDFLLIPPGTPHQILDAEASECWGLAICTHCYAQVCDGFVSRLFSEIAQGTCAVRRVEAEHHAWVCGLFERLAKELGRPCPYQAYATQGLLGMLFTEIARAKETKSPSVPIMTPLVAETLRYLEHHALQPISLADVAAAMKRNTAYLTTLIKQHTGWTVMEWLTQLRMNEARRLLLHSDEFVDIIAERVGFASPSHFHQIFRRLHQRTPAVWRKEHRHLSAS